MQHLKPFCCLGMLLFFFFCHLTIVYAQQNAPTERNHTIILLTLRGRAFEARYIRNNLKTIFNTMIDTLCLKPQAFAHNRPLIAEDDYYSFLGYGLQKDMDVRNSTFKTGLFFTNKQNNANSALQTIENYLEGKEKFPATSTPGMEYALTEALIANGAPPQPVTHTYVIWIGNGTKPKGIEYVEADRNIQGSAQAIERGKKLYDRLAFTAVLNDKKFFNRLPNDKTLGELWVEVYELLPAKLANLTPSDYLRVSKDKDFSLSRKNGKIGWQCSVRVKKTDTLNFDPLFVKGFIPAANDSTGAVALDSFSLRNQEMVLPFFYPGELTIPRIELKSWVRIQDGFYNSLVFPPSEKYRKVSTISIDLENKIKSVLGSDKLAKRLYRSVPIAKNQGVHASIFNVFFSLGIVFLVYILWRYVISYIIAYFS